MHYFNIYLSIPIEEYTIKSTISGTTNAMQNISNETNLEIFNSFIFLNFCNQSCRLVRDTNTYILNGYIFEFYCKYHSNIRNILVN